MNPEIGRRRTQLDFPRTRLWELRGAGGHGDFRVLTQMTQVNSGVFSEMGNTKEDLV